MKYFTTKQLSEMLSMSVSTISRMIHSGKIPCYRINNEYRFKADEINKWLKAQKVA
jgi:excisionase family DNA binding protein